MRADSKIPRLGRWWPLLGVASILSMGASAAFSEVIQKSIATNANPALSLHSHTGTISVKGWDQNQVEIKGERASDSMDVIIEGNADKISVMTHPKGQNLSRQEARVDLEIRVPRQTLLSVKTEGGDITIEDVEGGVTVEENPGSVTLSRIRGDITARTLDGPIVIRSSEGRIEAASVSGDLTFVQVNAAKFTATTNSGTIRYQGDFGLGGTYQLHSYGSPIDVQASPRASFDVDARSIQGTIENRIPLPSPPPASSIRPGRPGKSLQFRINSGKSTVQITSYSGTIRLSGAR